MITFKGDSSLGKVIFSREYYISRRVYVYNWFFFVLKGSFFTSSDPPFCLKLSYDVTMSPWRVCRPIKWSLSAFFCSPSSTNSWSLIHKVLSHNPVSNLFLVLLSPRLLRLFRLTFSVLFVSDWCPQVGNEEWLHIHVAGNYPWKSEPLPQKSPAAANKLILVVTDLTW